MVQFVKTSLKALQHEDGNLQCKLDKILLKYRITPHSTTGDTPCNLMFKRRIRTRLDNLRPSVEDRMREKTATSKKNDLPMRSFEDGQQVLVKDYRARKETWQPGVVEEKTTPTSYRVRTSEGGVWRRHADQMRTTSVHTQHMASRPELDSFEAAPQPTAAAVVEIKKVSIKKFANIL